MRLLAHDAEDPSLHPARWPMSVEQIEALLRPKGLPVGHLGVYPSRRGCPAGLLNSADQQRLHRRAEMLKPERLHHTRKDLPCAPAKESRNSRELLLLMEGHVLLLFMTERWPWTLQLDAGDWVCADSDLLLRIDAMAMVQGSSQIDLLRWRMPLQSVEPLPRATVHTQSTARDSRLAEALL
ncbi:hypothetical protein [Paucibacter sp. Y2R2-4]|uniref:hypothetical protein n=1 Tax=Paucibacter sp. Y2R2-4 TaxID=2893553 RepID=UPI0021E372EA|nr:hypothetical protein [Paucibacter sp. Y2R2-4]MCV2349856.1 hypothetical protein [Paucibacter sp. Y2R2-4]